MRVRDRICIGLGATALVTSITVMGGVLRWTQALVAILVAAALLSQVFARRAISRLSPLVLLLGVAIALTALQLVPLPESVLEVLNPVGQHLRADGAALTGADPWTSISLDPPATLGRLAFFTILLGVAVLALRFAASDRGRFWLLVGVALACGLAALIAGIHVLSQADTLYGLYQPQYLRGAPLLGPLINANHLGCLCAMGAVLAFALSFHTNQPTQLRLLLLVVGTGCAILVAASESRGAMIGLAFGMLVGGVLLVAGKGTTKKRSLRQDMPVAIVVAVGLGIGLYFSAGEVTSELSETSVTELDRMGTKFVAWKSSMELVEESPWFGIGRGATESTLPRVYAGSARATYQHLENEYVTALVEWGVIGSLVVGGALVACVLAAMRRRRDGPLAAAAIGAICVVIFQSSVDYGIELLGIAVPVTIIAATIQLVPLRPAASPTRAKILRLVLAVAIVGAGILLVTPATTTVREDQENVIATREQDAIVAAIDRHPLDYVAFGIAAEQAWRDNDPRAVALLNHALVLHPTHPGLHRLAARMLVRVRQYRQAAVEYAFVMRAEAQPRELLREVITVMPDAESAARAIPSDYPNREIITRSLGDLKRSDIAMVWMLQVANQSLYDVALIDQLYELAMREKNLAIAVEAAELRRRVSRTTTSRVMLARVLLARNELDRVITELADVRSWTGRLDEKGEAWLILCDAYLAKEQWDVGLECLHRLDGSGLQAGNRVKIEKRLHDVKQKRTTESKMQMLESMEREIRALDRKKGAGSAAP